MATQNPYAEESSPLINEYDEDSDASVDIKELEGSIIRNNSKMKWLMCVAISGSWLSSYFVAWFVIKSHSIQTFVCIYL